MTRKRETTTYADPQDSTAPAYRLPAYGSPVTEPSPIREPGSAPAPAIRLPGVDDRLARPETREEYIDNVRHEVMAGEPEHADPQAQLAYVVRACVAEGWIASTELLTRADRGSDFATDVCVRRKGKDPRTGQRYVEELSFEVANTQTLNDLEGRAKKLVRRGVRRVFAVMVREKEIREWRRGGWKVRSLRSEISDRALHKPLRVRGILDAAEADRLVVEALMAKGEPYLMKLIEKREAKGREEGREETLRRSIKDLCGALEIEGSAERAVAAEAMSGPELEALWAHLVSEKSWPRT